jgi:hypothetical protein
LTIDLPQYFSFFNIFSPIIDEGEVMGVSFGAGKNKNKVYPV